MKLPVITPSEGKGCSESSCGSTSAQQTALPLSVLEKIKNHPCYSEEAHHYFARMHVAVAPACNIQCNYCNRKYDCSNESRPGVVSELLSPAQAVKKTLAVAATIPQMTVLGIAGPGDPLANPERTFATFRELARRAPDIKLCVSTNGLALPEAVDELSKYNIDHVTITINCLDPVVGAQIYPWIFFNGQRLRGERAARILIRQQQRGLEMLVARGILVKVNSVMIPGVNDQHLVEVSRTVKAKGAFLHNVMPLISDEAHGTYYGVMGQRGPTPAELTALQDQCAGDMNMMRHCRQCRADAVGLLGEDRGAEFSLEAIEHMDIDYDEAMVRRKRVHEAIELQLAKNSVPPSPPEANVPERVPDTLVRLVDTNPAEFTAPKLFAVATKGHQLVNEHFGHAKEFLIYEASPRGVRFVSHRKVGLYCVGSDSCDEHDDVLGKIIETLADCSAVLCSKIGHEPWSRLEQAGIVPNAEHGMESIETAVQSVYQELSTLSRERGAGAAGALASCG